MRRLPPDLAERLAAEHALGTLRGRARARFEAIARADPAVRAIRERWELAFARLAESVPPVEPPARVWAAIEERIAGATPRGVRLGLGFWRSFGLLSGGVAAVLLAAFLVLSGAPHRGPPGSVAVLVSPTQEARMVIAMHPDALRIHNVRPWTKVREQGRVLELWALPKEGPARSLGLVANEPGDFVIRIRLGDERLRDARTIALSSEPAGGSPSHAPSGPVLCSGLVGTAGRI